MQAPRTRGNPRSRRSPPLEDRRGSSPSIPSIGRGGSWSPSKRSSPPFGTSQRLTMVKLPALAAGLIPHLDGRTRRRSPRARRTSERRATTYRSSGWIRGPPAAATSRSGERDRDIVEAETDRLVVVGDQPRRLRVSAGSPTRPRPPGRPRPRRRSTDHGCHAWLVFSTSARSDQSSPEVSRVSTPPTPPRSTGSALGCGAVRLYLGSSRDSLFIQTTIDLNLRGPALTRRFGGREDDA